MSRTAQSIRLASAALAAVMFAGIGGATFAGRGWAAEPKTFVWGKSGDADTLDLNVTSNGEAMEVTTQIFSLLVRTRQGRSDVEPDLATSWSLSPDGLVWTFKLRQGVTFHDGTPWNAEAAKFNFDRWADETNPYHAVQGYDYTYWKGFMADAFKEARVVDPYTLQLVLKQPNGPLINNLAIATFGFHSPAAIKQYGAREIGQHPVGTGPYRFGEWVRDDHITLEANPAYFRRGLPRTPRVVMRVIKDNAARLLALKAGELNAMENPNTDDIKTIQSDPRFSLGFRPAFNTGWLRFNMNMPLFQDKRVREAMTLAVNRRAIVQALYGEFGQVADQHMPPLMWGRGNITPIPYDPERAKRLLAEAGYGSGLSFDLWYLPFARPYFPQPKEIATAVANDLAKVGVKATLMTEDVAAYLRDRRTNKFPIFMIGWIGDNGDPDDWLGYFFPKFDPDNAYLSYNRPAVFDLINRAKVSTGQAQRAGMYAQAEALIMDDFRDILIAHARVPLLMQRNVEGLVGQPSSLEYMETVRLK